MHAVKSIRSLTDEERAELRRIVRSRRERVDRVARATALLALADGARPGDAARAAGYKTSATVVRLIARWNQLGLGALSRTRQRAIGADDARNGRVESNPPVSRRHDPLAHAAGVNPLTSAMAIPGALGAAIVELASGKVAAATGEPGFDVAVAASGNSEVVRAKVLVKKALGIQDCIEDILITLTGQYHILHVAGDTGQFFFYLVLNRERANLAIARRALAQIAVSWETANATPDDDDSRGVGAGGLK